MILTDFNVKSGVVSTIYPPIVVSDFNVKSGNLFTRNYSVPQLGNFGQLKEITPGVWESMYDINLNPNGVLDVQAVLDADSGTPGKVKFTAAELIALVTASSDLAIVWAEDAGYSVETADLETTIAYITCVVPTETKIIWSFTNIS